MDYCDTCNEWIRPATRRCAFHTDMCRCRMWTWETLFWWIRGSSIEVLLLPKKRHCAGTLSMMATQQQTDMNMVQRAWLHKILTDINPRELQSWLVVVLCASQRTMSNHRYVHTPVQTSSQRIPMKAHQTTWCSARQNTDSFCKCPFKRMSQLKSVTCRFQILQQMYQPSWCYLLYRDFFWTEGFQALGWLGRNSCLCTIRWWQ